jgi:AcrR family transcriptional regulator
MAKIDRKATAEILLTALANGASIENVARKAGVSVRTVYRRLEDPGFRAKLERRRLEAVQRISDVLTSASVAAIKTLLDIQQDVTAPASVRRAAARDVLELNLRYREIAPLEQRVAAIEEFVTSGLRGPPLPEENDYASTARWTAGISD